MKATVKSCSCQQCKAAKGTKGGRLLCKQAERAFRHQANQDVRQGKEEIIPAGSRPRIG